MKSVNKIYRFYAIIMVLTFLLPMSIFNIHLITEHQHEQNHDHDVLSFCDEEVSFCEYNDLAFHYFDITELSYQDNIVRLDNFLFNISFPDKLYSNNFSGTKKGRAPPYFV